MGRSGSTLARTNAQSYHPPDEPEGRSIPTGLWFDIISAPFSSSAPDLPMRCTLRWIVPLLLIVWTGRVEAASGQIPPPEEGAFVLLLGAADTFAVENFSRSPDRLTGEVIGQSIGRIAYSARLSDVGAVTELKLEFHGPGNPPSDPPDQAATFSFVDDSVRLAITLPEGVPHQHFHSPAEPFFYMNPSILLIEQLLHHARTIADDSGVIPVFIAQGEETYGARVTDIDTDHPVVSVGAVFNTALDPEGRLVSATLPQQGITVRRIDRHLSR